MDRVPLEYIFRKGIEIKTARKVYDIPIAEYTIGRILEWYKRFEATDNSIRNREWKKQRGLQELYGKTVCIYGYGSIGHAIGERIKSFGTYLIAVSRHKTNALNLPDLWVPPEEFPRISSDVDIIILTVPLTNDTYHMVNRAFLSNLSQKCLFVNVARGGLIDKQDLRSALGEGRISGAILDVFEDEPLNERSEEWDFENAMLSPHNSFEGEGNDRRLTELIVRNFNEMFQ